MKELLLANVEGPAIAVSIDRPFGGSTAAVDEEGRLEVDVLAAVNVGEGGLKVLPPLKLLLEFSSLSTSAMARPSESSKGCIAGIGLAAGDSGGVGGFSIALKSISVLLGSRLEKTDKNKGQPALQSTRLEGR